MDENSKKIMEIQINNLENKQSKLESRITNLENRHITLENQTDKKLAVIENTLKNNEENNKKSFDEINNKLDASKKMDDEINNSLNDIKFQLYKQKGFLAALTFIFGAIVAIINIVIKFL